MATYKTPGGNTYTAASANNSTGNISLEDVHKAIGVKATAPSYQPQTNALPKGYSTIPGPYDAKTGQLKGTLPNLAQNNTNTSGSAGTGNYNVGGTTAPIPQTNIIGGLINQANAPSQAYTDANSAYQKTIQDYNKSVQNEARGMAGIQGEAIPLQFQQGRQQVLQSQYAAQQAGLGGLVQGASNALGAANTASGQQIQAGQIAGGFNQPQFGISPGTGVGQPSTGQVDYSSSPYGSGATASSNVQSVKDAQSILNNISINSPAITSNLTRAVDLANSAHLDPNSPLITGLQHAVSSGFITSQALTAFNQVIASLNSALQSVGENPIDPSTITPTALNQLMQTIPNNLKVKSGSAQDFINKFPTGGSSSSSSSGNYSSGNPTSTNHPW